MILASPCQTVSVEEFAAIVGISRALVYQGARNGDLPVPVIRIGRRLRIPKIAVQRLIEGASSDPSLEV